MKAFLLGSWMASAAIVCVKLGLTNELSLSAALWGGTTFLAWAVLVLSGKSQ